MSKKYEFVEGDTKTLIDGAVLHRIRAVRDMLWHDVKAGDLGGYIEEEENLSHCDLSWVDACSRVIGNTTLRNSTVVDSTVVDSTVSHSKVRSSTVRDSTVELTMVRNSTLQDSTFERSVVEYSRVQHSTFLVSTLQDSYLRDSFIQDSTVKRDRIVGGEIFRDEQHILFQNVGSENARLTAYRAATGVRVIRGCFSGTLEEFESAVNEKHGDSQYGQEYRHLIAFIKLRASTWKKEG